MKRILLVIILFTLKAGAQAPALSLADSLYAVGNFDKAIQTLKSISPSTEAVRIRLAKSFQAKGNLDLAEKYYEDVFNNNPERILIAVDYAKLLSRTGNYELAEEIFRDLSKSYPSNASFQFQWGLVKEKRKDSTAIAHFFHTIELDSGHQSALYKVSKHALDQKLYADAERFSKQGLHTYAGNTALLSVLAQALYHQDKYREALDSFEKLLNLGKGSEAVHSTMAMAHYQLEEYDKSIEHYERALGYNDKNPGLHHNIGRLYAIAGNLERSETHLLIALVLKKQSVDAEYLSLALTYKLQEDYGKTLKYLTLALEENPDNERALFERAIAADNYFKDLQSKIDFYQAYITKYQGTGNRAMVDFAKTRYSELREELHLSP